MEQDIEPLVMEKQDSEKWDMSELLPTSGIFRPSINRNEDHNPRV